MNNPIMFIYVYQHDETGIIYSRKFDLSEIEDGQAVKIDRLSIIARNIYTGLKDANGKDMYDGDLVSCCVDDKPIGAVDTIEFKDGCFILRHRNMTIKKWLYGLKHNTSLNVIGNIYDNRIKSITK